MEEEEEKKRKQGGAEEGRGGGEEERKRRGGVGGGGEEKRKGEERRRRRKILEIFAPLYYNVGKYAEVQLRTHILYFGVFSQLAYSNKGAVSGVLLHLEIMLEFNDFMHS